MRYAIISKGLTADEMKLEAAKVGAKGIKEARLLGQVFCEMTEGQAESLSRVPGLAVKALRLVVPDMVTAPDLVGHQEPTELLDKAWSVFEGLRGLFTPHITGVGLTVAILDSGIHKTHQSLSNKVVYEENFTDSPSTDDVFGHGTQVAFVVAGGEHGGEPAGVSPGASLLNIKVLNDDGLGLEEDVVMGIERVCELVEEAETQGLPYTDPLWPNVINLSLGAPDDGDEDSPMRIACREAVELYGLDVVASAGNYGPEPGTVTSPGTEPKVTTVGAIQTTEAIEIWERSSRGPTKLGDAKPDFVFWGTDITAASNKDNTSYVAKSGTSFSAPMLSGLTGLLWEVTRRVYGENWIFKWSDAKDIGPFFCIKPEDAPKTKDFTYGFGLPAVGTMMERLAEAQPAVDISAMLGPLIMIMMMVGIVKMI